MVDKSKVLETLKQEYAENPLVSERTINEVLETLIHFANDDTDEDDFTEKVRSVLKTSEGNARKIAADTAKKVKKETKPTPKEQEPKEDEEDKGEDDDIPSWVKEITSSFNKQFSEVKKRLDESDTEKRAKAAREKAFKSESVAIYPKGVVEAAADGFDFGNENAEQLFVEKVARVASSLGVIPERGVPNDEKPDFTKFRERLKDRGLINEI